MDTPSDIYSACASPSPCASELGDNGLAHDFCAAPKPSLVGRTYQRYSKDQQRRLVVGGIPFRLRRAQITPGAAVTPTSTGANGATPQEESAASQRLATKVESTEQEHKVKTNNSNSSSKSHPPQGTDGRDDDTPVEAVPLARNRFFLDILTVGAGRRDEWILPKGGWESFETLHEGAIREVLEEAGVECTIEACLGVNDGYYGSNPERARSLFRMISFLMPVQRIFSAYAEAMRARNWFSLEELCTVIQRPAQVAILKKVLEHEIFRTYILIESLGYVRHQGYVSSADSGTQVEGESMKAFPIPQSPAYVRVDRQSGSIGTDGRTRYHYEVVAARPSQQIPKEVKLPSYEVDLQKPLPSHLQELKEKLRKGFYSLPKLDLRDIPDQDWVRAEALASERIRRCLEHVSRVLEVTQTPELRPFSEQEIEEC